MIFIRLWHPFIYCCCFHFFSFHLILLLQFILIFLHTSESLSSLSNSLLNYSENPSCVSFSRLCWHNLRVFLSSQTQFVSLSLASADTIFSVLFSNIQKVTYTFWAGYVRNNCHTVVIFLRTKPVLFLVMVQWSKWVIALDESGDEVVAHCIGADAMVLTYSESESDSGSGSDDDVELAARL